MRTASGLAAAAICSAVLAGCGGQAPTRSDVIARADAICASALREVRAVTPPEVVDSASSLAPYLRRVVPVLEREVASLERLPRPAAGRATLASYLAAVGRMGAQYRSLEAAAAHGDESGVLGALEAIRASPAPALAQSYGMGQCAAPAGTTA